jgi:RNA polymerase sigma factor (sigma-70 family)
MALGRLNAVLCSLRRLVGDESDDAVLLTRFARQGDQTAFETVVARHAGMVYATCQRILADAHLAEDAFQAVFVILARKAGQVAWRGSIAGWLHQVACRAAHKARRLAERRRRREVAQSEGELMSVDALPPAWNELRPLLDDEIAQLPDHYRLPIVLCYLEGKTYAEAASLLGLPSGTVSGRLARARDVLRSRLERRGIGVASATLAACLETLASSPHAQATDLVRAACTAALSGPTPDSLIHLVSQGVQRDMTMHTLRRAVVSSLLLAGLATGTGWLVASASNAKPAVPPAPTKEKEDAPQLTGPPVALLSQLGKPRAFIHCSAPQQFDFSTDGKSLVFSGFNCPPCACFPESGKVEEVKLPPDWVGATVSRDRRRALGLERHADGYDLLLVALDQERTVSKHPLPKLNATGLLYPASWLTFSPNDKFAACVAGGSVIILNAETGNAVAQWNFPLRSPKGAYQTTFGAFSSDGRLFFTAEAGQRAIHVWELATRKLRATFQTQGSVYSCLVVSPDGKSALVGQNAADLVLVSLVDGKELRRFARGQYGAFSPDGHSLAWADRTNSVHVLDLATGKVRQYHGRVPGFTMTTFSADGNRLAASGHGPVVVWDVATAKPLHDHAGHRAAPEIVAFSADSKTVLTADATGILGLWDLSSGKLVRHVEADATGHGGLSFVADAGLRVAAVAFGTPTRRVVAIWDLEQARCLHRLDDLASALALSPDGALLAALTNPISEQDNPKPQPAPGAPIPPQPPAKLQRLVLVDTKSGTVVQELDKVRSNLHLRGEFAKDGKHFVWFVFSVNSADKFDTTIHSWNLEAKTASAPYVVAGDNAVGSAWSKDNKELLVVSRKGFLVGLNPTTGKETRKHEIKPLFDPTRINHDGRPAIGGYEYLPSIAFAFSSDGGILASQVAGESQVHLWDTTAGKKLRTVGVKEATMLDRFTPDGQRFLTRTGPDVYFWNVADGKEILRARFDLPWIRTVMLAPDGTRFVTTSDDTTLAIWKVRQAGK